MDKNANNLRNNQGVNQTDNADIIANVCQHVVPTNFGSGSECWS